jgi:hypothetical protein
MNGSGGRNEVGVVEAKCHLQVSQETDWILSSGNRFDPVSILHCGFDSMCWCDCRTCRHNSTIDLLALSGFTSQFINTFTRQRKYSPLGLISRMDSS